MRRREFIVGSVGLLAGCAKPSNSLVRDGAWTWFNGPRAVIHDAKLVVGSVSSRGIVQLTSEGVTRPVASLGEQDDHDNPGLLSLPGGLAAFYSRHNDKVGTRYRINDEPERIIPGRLPVTYARPFLVGGAVLLFRRHWTTGRGEHQLCRSSDLRNWTVETAFGVPGQRPYVQACQSGDRIDFAATAGHPSEIRTGVYHFFYDRGFYRSDGSRLPTPFDVRQATEVCEPQCWVWDIQPGRILSTKHPGIEYWLHEYDGQWRGKRLATGERALYAKEPFYAGGLCFVGDEIAMSLNRRIAVGGRFIGSGIRPYSPDGKSLLWMSGEYDSYRDFGTSIVTS